MVDMLQYVTYRNIYMPRNRKPLIIAGFISIMIIGIALYTLMKDEPRVTQATPEESAEERIAKVRNINESDHVLGNPAAPIIFYVYSDFSCPYCKEYHETLKTLMKLYGNEGQFAWVFRHVPYVQLHPEAPMYALASECVAEEAGNEGFWKFSNDLFDKVDPLAPFGAADLVILAEASGATRQNFVTCMRSNELMEKVERDFNEAVESGAKGSPYTIIQTANKRSVYQGAQPFKNLAVALQTAIRTEGITELEAPSSGKQSETSIADQFEALEQEMFTATQTPEASKVSTTSEVSDSILDGIIE